MNRWFFTFLLLACTTPAIAQLPPDKALASLKVADGLQVELFAAEPMLINPTAMDIDHKGRVWITEGVNYRRKNFGRPILREEGDRIQVLIDESGSGKATKAVTFYQGKDLIAPLSVCVLPQPDGKLRVLVAQSPDILEFWDKDGDLKADGPPTKFLTGFNGFDHDHGVHGLSVGPDGKLYFTVGDAGVKGLQSKDGKGPKWTSNATDCRAGTVWRCDLDGNNLELIAHNFRNNYECCVDSFGEVWLSDNDDDGNQQTRICFVMPGGNYGYHPRGPGQSHWHEEQPGVVHKAIRTGFGSPTGICFYEGTLLPEKYHGQLLHTDAGPRELRAFLRKPKGAGYEMEKVDILTSTDNWFRLADVCVAPDGSVFVCDWYDPGVGGHGMGDWTRGRVYRVTPKGHVGYKVPAVKLDNYDGIVEALLSPNLVARSTAIAQLRSKSAAELIAWTSNRGEAGQPRLKQPESKAAMARLLWQFKRFLEVPEPDKETKELAGFLLFLLLWPDDGINDPLWVRILSDGGIFANPSRYELKFDNRLTRPTPGPAVAREWAIALRKLPPEDMTRIFYRLASYYDGKDHFYRAALNIACGTDAARRDAILADFDRHFPEWNDKVADLVWELRPKSVLPRLDKLLTDPKLTAMQKARVVDILAVNDDPAAGKSLLTLLAGDAPAEVKARALDNLRLFLPTKWNALANSDDLKSTITRMLAEPKTVATGLQLVAAANFNPALDAVAKLATDGSNELKLEAVRTLGKLNNDRAIPHLIRLAQPENPLSIECVKALGSRLPNTQVYPHAQSDALKYLQDLVVSKTASHDLRLTAVAAMAGNRHGSSALFYWKEKNELPADLAAETGRILRNSPNQATRNKALLLFPAPGKLNIKALPANAELAKRKGNAENGKAIFAKSLTSEVQCLKCHTVRGQGGQIGPDLSMIGKKGSRENLFESILQPSKAIADQHVSWKIDTLDGQSLTGLIVGETPQTVTLRDANGKDYPIAVKDIDKRSKSLVSLMPDNLAAALTEDELIDVVEYMTTLQTAALTPDSWWVIGPFVRPGGNEGLDHLHGPEQVPFDAKATFPEWNGPSSGPAPKPRTWKQVRIAANGYYDLAALHGDAANNSVSFAYREIESPADQDAEILLGTDDGAKLWVNGKLVHTEKTTRAAAPEQSRVSVKLKKGSNAVLLKVANGNNPHGFYVTITSSQELKAK